MTQDNLMIIIAFALYLGLMMYIGVYYYRKSNSIGDYILGGRQLGPWITALSAEASDTVTYTHLRAHETMANLG